MQPAWAIFVGAGSLFLAALRAPAASELAPIIVHGVRFAPTATVQNHAVDLRGAGLLRVGHLFSVYAAAFYAAPGNATADPLGNYAKRLEVEYLMSVKAKDLNDAGDKVLSRALPAAQLGALRPRLDQIAAWYPDTQRGDRCALTYSPGRGTELTVNGHSLGIIPGEDFQHAYFQIWLGAEPASVPLRDALLKTTSQ